MTSLNWGLIGDQLLRYYFAPLILLIAMLLLIFTDKSLSRVYKASVLSLCLMLLILIVEEVFGYALAGLPYRTIWRAIGSVTGYVLRPACLVPVLLDTMPGVRQNKKRLFLVLLPALVNAAIFCTAFFSPIAISFDANNEFHRGPLFPVVIVVSVLYMVQLAYNAITKVRRRNRRKYMYILLMVMACFAAALLDMNGIVYPAPLLDQTIAIGTTLYFLVQYMIISTETIENVTLSMLLMQIRPHFINNSLAAIRGLIRRNPEQAVEALNHFSGYLQDTMHSIAKTNLIPFSQEMSLIDNYLYMEQTRFSGSITVVKQLIDVDFPIPPLTVQPLVENAVRHGLRGIQTPGELIIRTEMDAKEYRIVVIDNGCGFDTTQPPDPRREHVGLKNVRTRLDIMCNGTLTIRSTPGSGTTSTIHIPAKIMATMQSGTAAPLS